MISAIAPATINAVSEKKTALPVTPKNVASIAARPKNATAHSMPFLLIEAASPRKMLIALR